MMRWKRERHTFERKALRSRRLKESGGANVHGTEIAELERSIQISHYIMEIRWLILINDGCSFELRRNIHERSRIYGGRSIGHDPSPDYRVHKAE